MRRWWLALLLATALGAGLAARWADARVPASRTIGVIPVPGQASLPRPAGMPPDRHRAWRMVLRLDPDLRQPGPEWVLREGRAPGLGYELAWLPGALSLQLTRGGEQPLVLGAVRLQRPPREVVLARRGAALSVSVDGRPVLDALDPEGIPEPADRRPFPDGWSVLTPSALGASTFAVHDEGDLPTAFASDLAPGDVDGLVRAIALGPLDPAERLRAGSADREPGQPGYREPPQPGRHDHALLLVRQALMQRADREPLAAASALGRAARAVAALGSAHPDRARLGLWLAWGEARNALAGAGTDGAAQVRPAIDQLIVAVGQQGSPEGPGMLLALLPELAERAMRRPPAPRPLLQVLDERAAWLATLDIAARAAAEALPAGTSPDLALQLRFIAHTCGALGDGGAGEPLPAEAPEWLAARWRMLAGGLPPESGLPAAPASQVARSPVLPVVEALVRGAARGPLAAVRLRAGLSDRQAGARGADRILESLFEAAPPREAALARAMLALDALERLSQSTAGRRVPPAELISAIEAVRGAVAALGDVVSAADDGPRRQLVQRDPLAFAVACLAESRIRRLAGQPGEGLTQTPWQAPEPGVARAFVQLAPFAQLLSGDQAASELIWLHDDEILPPAQALAAALAMREVREDERYRLAGRKRPLHVPDWRLLRRLRSFSLPLELLAEREPETAASDRPTPLLP